MGELKPIPAPHFVIPATETDLLEAFLAGRNPNTLRAYDGDIADFASFLGAPSSQEAINAFLAGGHGQANGLALRYRADMVRRGLGSAAIRRRLAALRSVVKLARTLGMVPWSLEVEAPRDEPYRDTIACGSEGWKAILDLAKQEADGNAPKAVRDLAIIRSLHDLGLRRGELVATNADSLDLPRSTLSIVGKGKSEPIKLTLPDPTHAALSRWLSVRGSGPGPLFVRLDRAAPGRGRLTGEAVRLLVAAFAARASVAGPVRPHGLRHIAVTEVLDRNGGDIRAAQEFARHADPKTTLRYDRNRRDLAGSMAKLIADD